MKDEDIEYGKWQQAKIERDWDVVPITLSIPIHQKIGTVIPFSRTVDRDPHPRIPLTVPEPVMKITKLEAAIWLAVVGAWLAYLFFGPGAW
jgi:hypothetical protein